MSVSSGHGAAVAQWASGRRAYVDNLKVLLIAGIIAGHAIASYSDEDFWSYAEMNEVTLSQPTQIMLYAVVAPATLLMIPLLFLVAGLLTPGSVDRKGTGPFVRDRLLRLGVPFAAYVLLVQPAFMYPVHPPGEQPSSYWAEFLGGGDQTLDAGPLWFVGVLLLFSLGYALIVRARGGQSSTPRRVELTARLFALVAVMVAVATFLVRLAIPLSGSNKVLTLNLWEWPGCLTVFAIGVLGYRQGWLDALPEALRRRCRAVTLAALAGFAVFAAVIPVIGMDEDRMWGGWDWPAAVFVALESLLVVFGSLWLLSAAQRHLDRGFRWAGPRISRSAYGAFMVQVVPLIGLAFALRPVPLPAEVKALVLAVGSVVASFGVAWLLISRVPGLKRVL